MRRLLPLMAFAVTGCSPVAINARDVQRGVEAFYLERLSGSAYNGQVVVRCAQIADFRRENTEENGAQVVAVRFAMPLENGKGTVWRLRFRLEGQVWKLSYSGDASKLPCKTAAVGLLTDATYASSSLRDLK